MDKGLCKTCKHYNKNYPYMQYMYLTDCTKYVKEKNIIKIIWKHILAIFI